LEKKRFKKKHWVPGRSRVLPCTPAINDLEAKEKSFDATQNWHGPGTCT
jgi:hypothetical protein